ncbi:MAG: RES domain-containing protein [Gammaproteobacteria bacterium]|nr:RES domain-containing protein [Gammaproteobacteria bacterium]
MVKRRRASPSDDPQTRPIAAYRIGDPAGRFPVYSGAGAAVYPGRWNAAGQRVIYASEHYSTALVEKLVYTLRLPPNQHFVQTTYLSRFRGTSGRTKTCQSAGIPMIPQLLAPLERIGSAPVALVPSSVAPLERNVLINPAHPEASLLVVGPETPVPWDHRLFPQS